MDTVKISGIEYPVHFGLSVIKDFCKAKGIELGRFQELIASINFQDPGADDIETFTDLMRLGFVRGGEKVGKEFTMTTNDMIDAITEDEEYLSRAMEVFMSQMVSQTKKKNNPAPQEKG